ncbi:MAG: STAS domain-containing protein [Solirubrobacteraceae bacterium]
MRSELQATVRERHGAAVVDLLGEIDRSADTPLTEAYSNAASGGAHNVILNFEQTDYINSTGIALIVDLLAQARAQGVQISACGLSDHYREIFEITRLADFMTIADSEDAAIGAAQGRGDE